MISLNIHKKLMSATGEMNLDIDVNITAGELITLYGESGAGKTSTLRMLSGLMIPDKGRIMVNGQTWFDHSRNINLPPQTRRIGYVFQDYALFPNMTIQQNLEYAHGKNRNRKIIDDLVEIAGLGELRNRKPDSLSGGQKQRVAVARAIVQNPEILLLDEPLAALDHKIKLKLQDYILQLHKEYGLTTILVSHDIGEILKLSDRVFIMENGKITRQGSASEVFVDKQVSGKFKFTGEVISLEKQDVVCIVTVLIGNTVVKVIAQPEEINNLKAGDKVLVASKAFNPIIYKLE